ncbi:unnamed protein product [Prunus armeniaca]
MSQDNVRRHEGAEGIRLAYCKARCRRYETCMSQGDVPRHEGAEGVKLACRKAMCVGMRVPKA